MGSVGRCDSDSEKRVESGGFKIATYFDPFDVLGFSAFVADSILWIQINFESLLSK